MDLAHHVVREDLLESEVAKQVFLGDLATHEYGQAVEVVAVFGLEEVRLLHGADPAGDVQASRGECEVAVAGRLVGRHDATKFAY